jgi:hypothetical protein
MAELYPRWVAAHGVFVAWIGWYRPYATNHVELRQSLLWRREV